MDERLKEQTGYAYALRDVIKIQKELIIELREKIERLEIELIETKKVYTKPKKVSYKQRKEKSE